MLQPDIVRLHAGARQPRPAAPRHRRLPAHPALIGRSGRSGRLRADPGRLRAGGARPDRLGDGERADLPSAGRRAPASTPCCSSFSPSRHRIVVAVTLAWLTERTDLPLARLWSWLAVVPLAIPAFVHSYAWDGLFPWLRGLWPAVAISVLAYFPFVYLPVVAQLRRLDPALEDVAASLGEPPARVFLRVVLPQLRLAIAGGALLIALHLLAEYGLFVLIRFDTLTTAIVDQFQAVYDGPAANLLGIVLVACAAGVLGLEAWLRGNRRYARIGPGAARVMPRTPLGRAWPLWTLVPARSGGALGRCCRWRRSCAGSGAAARRPGTCRRSARRSGRRRSTRSRGAVLACLAALAGGLDVGPDAGAPAARARGLPPLRRLAARRHRRAGAGGGHGPGRAAALPDRGDAARRLCPALPRPRHHRASRQPGAGPDRARAGGGRARPSAAPRGGRDHVAAGGAGHRRRHGARRHGGHHRAHRDADAEPDRHPHARHRVLGVDRRVRPRWPPRPMRWR